MGYAYLKELGLGDLTEAIKSMVEGSDLDTSRVVSSPLQIEDIVTEIVHAIYEFPDWYFGPEEDDVRKTWVPTKDVPANPELANLVRPIVEDQLKGMREADELTVEPDVNTLVTTLAGLAQSFPNWYYDYKEKRDEEDWLETRSNHLAIYVESPYGNGDDLPGNSNAFDDDFNQYSVDDAGVDYGGQAEASSVFSGFIKLSE